MIRTQQTHNKINTVLFLISNFRRVLNVLCFLLGNSPASEFYTPTFWEHSVGSIFICAYEDETECSKTSEYKIHKPGNYPEESIKLYYSF
jgi:hypothetical protein